MGSTSHLYCIYCGAANLLYARFCVTCGKVLALSVSAPLMTFAEQKVGEHASQVLGSILKGRYRILEQIGQGGFSDVYKAEDTQFADRLVAIKVMSLDRLSQAERAQASEAFKQEALLLANLTHPHLASIYDYFAENGSWYLVMSYIEGETLEAYLQKAPGGQLPLAQVLQLALDLCSVLGYLHERQPPIIFRDLKPANVMRTLTGQLYLIDFGIARLFKPGQSRDTIALGSPGYAAPEQYGKMQTTPRTDIYALGVTMHHLLSGTDPADAPFLFAPLSSQVPAELNTLIMRMLHNDARLRPESMVEVKQALQQIAQNSGNHPQGLAAQGSPQEHKGPVFVTPLETASASEEAGRGARQQQQQVYYQPSSSQPTQPRLSRRAILLGAGGLVAAGGVTALLFRQLMSRATTPVVVRSTPIIQQSTVLPAMRPSLSVAPMMIKWSPDGQSIAYSDSVGNIYLKNFNIGKTQSYSLHAGPVSSVAWSPDGRTIASGSYDTTVKVWEVGTGKVLCTYTNHIGPVLSVDWSRDGIWLVSSDSDHTAQVWSPAGGKTMMVYGHHSDQVTSVAWAPDGKHIASGSADKTVQVWDAFSGETVYTYGGHTQTVQCVAWSQDNNRIASASNDQTVQVWDAMNGRDVLTYRGHTDQVWGVNWSANGRSLASASLDRTVQVWDAANGTLHYTYYGHALGVIGVSWSAANGSISSIDEGGNVEIWSPPNITYGPL